MSESYSSFPGFHFTFPSISSPLAIQSIKVYYLNMGATLAYGEARAGNARNTNIKNAVGDWGSGPVPIFFHVLNTPTCNYHPMDINNNTPYDEIGLETNNVTGDYRGYRDVFLLPVGSTDGCIPTLTTPVR